MSTQTPEPPEVTRMTVPELRLRWGQFKEAVLIKSVYVSSPEVTALAAHTAEGEPLCAFSVNLVDNPPKPGCIWVKTWSEGAGNLEELERLQLAVRTGRFANAGFGVAYEVRLIGDLA